MIKLGSGDRAGSLAPLQHTPLSGQSKPDDSLQPQDCHLHLGSLPETFASSLRFCAATTPYQPLPPRLPADCGDGQEFIFPPHLPHQHTSVTGEADFQETRKQSTRVCLLGFFLKTHFNIPLFKSVGLLAHLQEERRDNKPRLLQRCRLLNETAAAVRPSHAAARSPPPPPAPGAARAALTSRHRSRGRARPSPAAPGRYAPAAPRLPAGGSAFDLTRPTPRRSPPERRRRRRRRPTLPAATGSR